MLKTNVFNNNNRELQTSENKKRKRKTFKNLTNN